MAQSPKPLMIKLTPALIRRLLIELGDTPAKIARKLRRHHAKGIPKKSTACPLAIYLKYRLLLAGVDRPAVGVHADHVEMRFPCSFGVKTTNAARAFVSRFDDGKYPSLILK